MKKEEINELIEERFKNISRYFRRAISNFEIENISQFRTEIKKLKTFLRLLSIQSEDGLSYHISKRMKTIYGYLGIIKNFQTQLQETNGYLKKSASVPDYYIHMLEKELAYWKKNSRNFLDVDYDFNNDKQALINTLPEKLTKNSIKKFIYYTLYELQSLSGHLSEESLDSVRKFMEDIYYNFTFIKPYLTEQQTNLINEKTIRDYLSLFNDFRDRGMYVTFLQTFDKGELNENERQLLMEAESKWQKEKEQLKNELCERLNSFHVKAGNLNKFAYANPNE